MKKVAVTGGLSCGKTTVCKIFKDLGAYVVSADEIVHQLLSPDTEIGTVVIRLLGPEVVHLGAIDRAKVAQIVFKDPKKLLQLTSLLHPAVEKEINKEAEKALELGFSLFIAEVPLLFEAGQEKNFDGVIVVMAENELAKARYLNKGLTLFDFEKRQREQMPLHEKAKRADIFIQNNGHLEDLKREVTKVYHQLISRKER